MNTTEKPLTNNPEAELEKKGTSNSGRILWNFIFKNQTHKWYVIIGIVSIILQLTIFKYFYPYAGFINGDSYAYIETAYHNLSINTYPIGYSMLLRILSVFTKSDTILVVIQYLLLQLSVLAFIFTLFYFYKPARLTKILLFSFMLFNPVFLYLANYISSDSFFISLSMIWFTQLFWIINQPNNKLILINSLVLFLAFTVRYNALFYPIIAVVSLFQGRLKTWHKLGGLALSTILIFSFITFTSSKYYNLTGHRQFTPFTGWQTANNALYAYRYADTNHIKKVPKRFQELDKMVRTYFDTTRDIRKYPKEGLVASTVYMWDPSSPLCIYTENQFKKDSTATQLKKWATVAPLMGDYGSFLIKEYPREYVNYYLMPNIIKYYAPPIEFLEWYSTGVDSVSMVAQVWFNYKTTKLKSHFKDYKVRSLSFFPILTGTMNIVLLFSLISFIILQGYKKYPRLKNGMLLVITLWLVNFGFSVLASPIALRFQLFPILVSFSFTFFLVEYLIKSASGIETTLNSVDIQNNSLEPAA
ncbi:hypothetical protein QFZ48_003776 [Chitinophaga sp. W2I13]|uniref:hypothetical protein n=1 Tax=Chitinophaga sp. W2I13 TaxID=3373923 RepID=UPI003D1B00FF